MRPAKLEAEIRAVRDMRRAILSAAKGTARREQIAAERCGLASDAHYAARAGREESERLLRSLDRLLRMRLTELGE